MSVNEKIRLIREAKGLTQEQIAEKLEIAPSTYGDIERGENDLKLSKLQKIAEVLEIKLSELFELNEKGALNIINCSDFDKKNKVYIGSSSATELEKQLLIVELKDKELAMKNKEVENLQAQISQLQEINGMLKEKIAGNN
jgi:transcriptional regulator with XRE-family HTH domain